MVSSIPAYMTNVVVAALVVNYGSDMHRAGFVGKDTIRALVPSVVDRMLGIIAGMAQKDSYAAGCASVRSVFPSVVVGPKMLYILVGMDWKESYAARLSPRSSSIRQCIFLAGFAVFDASHAVFPFLSAGSRCRAAALVVNKGSGMFYAGFIGYDTPRAVSLVCRQARDARRHVWFLRCRARRHCGSGVVWAGFARDAPLRAVFPMVVFRPR